MENVKFKISEYELKLFLSRAKEFYKDPKNVADFEEWKKQKQGGKYADHINYGPDRGEPREA